MPSRPPDPGTFESLLNTVDVDITHAVRLSISAATEPYWAKRAAYRFDDHPTTPHAQRFGVVYVAATLEAAFCESVIHESGLFRNGRWEVDAAQFSRRVKVRFRHPSRRALKLVDLTDAALKRLGLNADLTTGDNYDDPQGWSTAIHAAVPAADGLLYRSRQLPSAHCYALFERSGLVLHAVDGPMTDEEREAVCRRFGVVPIPS